MGLVLKSSGFAHETRIPNKYTADGPDVSPSLEWSDAPAGTKAWALIMDDPDAPMGTWVHWVIYDVPAETKSLAEGIGKGASLPKGTKDGKNSWNKLGYGGPSPPPGKPHRYYFKLYALSAPTALAAGATKADVEKAMQGKILAQAQWMGTYGR